MITPAPATSDSEELQLLPTTRWRGRVLFVVLQIHSLTWLCLAGQRHRSDRYRRRLSPEEVGSVLGPVHYRSSMHSPASLTVLHCSSHIRFAPATRTQSRLSAVVVHLLSSRVTVSTIPVDRVRRMHRPTWCKGFIRTLVESTQHSSLLETARRCSLTSWSSYTWLLCARVGMQSFAVDDTSITAWRNDVGGVGSKSISQ